GLTQRRRERWENFQSSLRGRHLDEQTYSRIELCVLRAFALDNSSLNHRVRANSGRRRISPPDNADSWARIPTHVQLALVGAFGPGSRSSTSAVINSFTRCGCEPPWPEPCKKDKCSASTIERVNGRIGSGSKCAKSGIST